MLEWRISIKPKRRRNEPREKSIEVELGRASSYLVVMQTKEAKRPGCLRDSASGLLD